MKIGFLLLVLCAPAIAQTAADSLSDSLHAPAIVIQRNFDPTRPTHLKVGALVCQQWQLMRGAAEDLAKTDPEQREPVLRRYKCAIADQKITVDVMRPDAHSITEMAESTYGYVGVRWIRSDGSFDFGFVGPRAVEN